MRKLFWLLFLVSVAHLHGNLPVKSPEEVQREVQQADMTLEIAQKMFNPWYTGPLITAPANNVPYQKINIQGYLYLTNQYGQYTNHRKSVNIPNIYTISPLLIFQYGLTPWLDFTAQAQGFFRWQKARSISNISDVGVTFGIQALVETLYRPSIRITVGQTFPTGKYERFNNEETSIASTGGGVYATSVGLNVSKVFWFSPLHPLSVRLSTSYTIPDEKAHVHGFNAYGGGFGTDGKIAVGQTFNADLGLEMSLTQKWVLATDLAYTCTTQSTFRGINGTLLNGESAVNGADFSDQLSFAPAIEYNPSSHGGFIGGVWFPITGKNSGNFISIVLSYTYLF